MFSALSGGGFGPDTGPGLCAFFEVKVGRLNFWSDFERGPEGHESPEGIVYFFLWEIVSRFEAATLLMRKGRD